jgi:DNA polymerase
VLLGAVASQSVFGSGFRVTSQRGRVLQAPDGTTTIATLHPSSILRGSPDSRQSRMRDLVDDLTLAEETLKRMRHQ